MVTSFPCSVEKRGQLVPKCLERIEPRREDGVSLRCERVRPLRRTWEVAAPLGHDELLVLECPKRAVDVPHVDALVADKSRKALEELVPVGRAVTEKQEQSGLAEPLDTRVNLPASVLKPAAVAAAVSATPVHTAIICNLHM
jgi:hypothetical protein